MGQATTKPPATPPFEFDDLQYIVMEGGGARGAAYLGAVRALEKMMGRRASTSCYAVTNRKPGLLDYYVTENSKQIPVIKGIAGSSAGAITTFALGLGFNSEEIEKILQYDFTHFLSEKDSGKYRMVKEDGTLAIGQDKKNKITGGKELSFDKAFEFKTMQLLLVIMN
jgi:predicted acylesterase/phospholipase RssA